MNRDALFRRLREKPFGGALSQKQLDGTNALLDVWESKYRERTPPTQFAACLATSFHETGHTMRPVKEMGGDAYLKRQYDPRGVRPRIAAQLGNTQPGDGVRYCGRGHVQLTGRGNYAKATQRLRTLGYEVDLVANPELALRPDIAAVLLFEGMEGGWFTGKTLDQLVDAKVDGDEAKDFLHSRAIINGKDRAEMIANYAQAFLAALVAAGVEIAAPKPLAPLPPPTPAAPPKQASNPRVEGYQPAPPVAPAKQGKFRTLLYRYLRD
jgi:putative chitinase